MAVRVQGFWRQRRQIQPPAQGLAPPRCAQQIAAMDDVCPIETARIDDRQHDLAAAGERVQSLHILPLPGASADEPEFAIILAPLSAALDSSGDMVASLYGLTEAERRVFEHVAAGRSVEQAAAALGVAGSTIRTHLLKVFSKTDTARQAELVALAAAFLPLVRR